MLPRRSTVNVLLVLAMVLILVQVLLASNREQHHSDYYFTSTTTTATTGRESAHDGRPQLLIASPNKAVDDDDYDDDDDNYDATSPNKAVDDDDDDNIDIALTSSGNSDSNDQLLLQQQQDEEDKEKEQKMLLELEELELKELMAAKAQLPDKDKLALVVDTEEVAYIDKQTSATDTDAQDQQALTTSNRWIVVTSSSTAGVTNIKALCRLDGWQTVVVAHAQSVWNPDDDASECIYLSMEEQQWLGYTVSELLPVGSLTRKNIGYLYAIQHGAEVILDTDDDMALPGDGDHVHLFNLSNSLNYSGDDDTMVSWHRNATDAIPVANPYVHFGSVALPRGGSTASSHPIYARSPPLAGQRRNRYIVQGLIDGPPDVVVQHHQQQQRRRQQQRFCSNVPALRLEPGLFGPVNSRNTLFHRDALWAMVLPVTVPPRMADIWRGYWAQRLLWDIDGRVVYFGAVAHLESSATSSSSSSSSSSDSHSDSSAADSLDTYETAEDHLETDRLLRLLDSWAPQSPPTLPERMAELAQLLALNDFIQDHDVQLVRMWINDLVQSGYVFPAMLDAQQPPPQQQRALSLAAQQRLQVCSLRRHWSAVLQPAFKDLLLVVHVTSAHSIAALGDLYGPAFDDNLVFVADDLHVDPSSLASLCPSPYRVLLANGTTVMKELHGNAASKGMGLLWTTEGAHLNYWNVMGDLDRSKFWFPDPFDGKMIACTDTASDASGSSSAAASSSSSLSFSEYVDVFRVWVDNHKEDVALSPMSSTVFHPLCAALSTSPFFIFRSLAPAVVHIPPNNEHAAAFFDLLALFLSSPVNPPLEIALPSALLVTVPPSDIQPLLQAHLTTGAADDFAAQLLLSIKS